MSDPTREALVQVAAVAIYTQQWGSPPSNDAERCAWRSDASAAVDAILATHLVVPRSDIVGTEYGIRYTSEDGKASTWPSKATSRAEVVELRQPGVTVLERPVLPWSPIPLPEDGTE